MQKGWTQLVPTGNLIKHTSHRLSSEDSDDNDDRSFDSDDQFFDHRSEFLLVCDRGHLASFAQVLAPTKLWQSRYCQSNHDNITAIKSTKSMRKNHNCWQLLRSVPPDHLLHRHGVWRDDFWHSLRHSWQEKGWSHFHPDYLYPRDAK